MVTPLTVEFLRMDFDEPGLLKEKGQYLLTHGPDAPPQQFGSPFGHDRVLDLLGRLRYRSEKSSKSAIQELQKRVTEILNLPECSCEDLLQLDLVTEISELWPIPFEAALDDKGKSLLLDPDRKVVLTRRRRSGPVFRRLCWEPHPRILFAWASPDWTEQKKVPQDHHFEALKTALIPWVESPPGHTGAMPKLDKYLTVLPEATVADIANACREAKENGKPYGYIHILAHGAEIEDPRGVHRNCIGVCLTDHDKVPTSPESLNAAIHTANSSPSVVTLAVCNSGDSSNPFSSGRSLAQELHRNGVPIVIASQLPLTFQGSTTLTQTLYPGLLNGEDIRETLFDVRHRLYEEVTDSHDWLSMVAYVRLPEDYNQVRARRSIAATLGRLRTAQDWADTLLTNTASDQNYAKVANRLSECIDTLAEEIEKDVVKNDQGLLLESLGLLGSAHKRRAQLLFRWKPEHVEESRNALIASRSWYTKANDKNLSHHWTGVQALSTHAVLDGRIDHAWWAGTAFAARREYENEDADIEVRMWACGTLAELQLLAACTGQEHDGSLEPANAYLQHMMKAVHENKSCDVFLVDSTRSQLLRYVEWWTRHNGYFGDRESDLAIEATQLVDELRWRG